MIDTLLMSCCCFGLLLVTTAMHYEALWALNRWLERLAPTLRARMAVVVFSLFVVHVAEVFAYAAAFCLLARHAGMGTLGKIGPPSFNVALYFSFETYSSLGYGDVVPSGVLRLMAGAEALNGLLLIGWSASYAHVVMERFWQQREQRRPNSRERQFRMSRRPQTPVPPVKAAVVCGSRGGNGGAQPPTRAKAANGLQHAGKKRA